MVDVTAGYPTGADERDPPGGPGNAARDTGTSRVAPGVEPFLHREIHQGAHRQGARSANPTGRSPPGGRRSSVLELNPAAGLEIVLLLEATTVRGSRPGHLGPGARGRSGSRASRHAPRGAAGRDLRSHRCSALPRRRLRGAHPRDRNRAGRAYRPRRRASPTSTCTPATGTTCRCAASWRIGTPSPATW